MIVLNLVVQTNCYTKFGIEWFPVKEQDRVSGYLYLSQLAGYAITAGASPAFIGPDDHKNPQKGFENMKHYLIMTICLTSVLNIGVIFFFQEKPKKDHGPAE